MIASRAHTVAKDVIENTDVFKILLLVEEKAKQGYFSVVLSHKDAPNHLQSEKLKTMGYEVGSDGYGKVSISWGSPD